MGRSAEAALSALMATALLLGGASSLWSLWSLEANAYVPSYDEALVLRPDSTEFEHAPTGIGPGVEPTLYSDLYGFVIETRSLDDEPSYARWNGSAFVPIDRPAPGAMEQDDDLGPVRMLDETTIVRDDGVAQLLEDGTRRPIDVPFPHVVLPAGPHRALFVLGGGLGSDASETRTFFVDTTSLAITPGPSTPPYTSPCVGSDAEGTVFILPDRDVHVIDWPQVILLGSATLLGVAGLAVVAMRVKRGHWPASGAIAGVAMGIVLVLAGALLWISVLSGMRFT